MTESERDALIRSVISSEAIEGLVLSYDEVSELLDQVMTEPPIRLGKEQTNGIEE